MRDRRVQGEPNQEGHRRGACRVYRTALVIDRRIEIADSVSAGLRVGHRRQPAGTSSAEPYACSSADQSISETPSSSPATPHNNRAG